jgi:MFS family permease
VSLAFALRTETGGLAAPLVGILVDRYGTRRVLLLGIALMAAGVLIMSYMQNLWVFYGAMVVIALGTSAAGGQVGMVATATWFERRRSRAMSIMTTGGGLAGLLVVGVAALVDWFGWRDALRWMAAIVIGMGVPLALLVRNRPAGHAQPMDGLHTVDEAPGSENRGFSWGVPVRQALRSRSFVYLALANAGFGFGTTAIIVHQVPFLEAQGVSSTAAGATVAAFALISVVGRLAFGYLGDKYDKRIMLAIAFGITAFGMVPFAFVTELWQAAIVLAIIAPGFGGAIPVRPALVADNFGTLYFGTLNGLLFTAMTFGSFFGPLLVGILVDVTGEYTMGWLVSAGVTALAIPCALAARQPTALIERYRLRPELA